VPARAGQGISRLGFRNRPKERRRRSGTETAVLHFTIETTLLVCVPKVSQTMASALIRQVFVQPDAASAHAAWRQVADQLRARFPKAAGPDG
jgi:transposase-like protein